MKKPILFVAFFFLFAGRAVAQNDCVDAIIICGDANLSNLDTQGFGIQEIFANACSSHENNSIWLKIKIQTGGTFGFLITPESSALVVDFDFWILGPNVECSNMGTAVRCSTTNPLNAQLAYNTTGMNDSETDVSEGPGPDGNAFIHWMNVLDNETYYIAIDRPVGESNFSIVWTGTATFYEPPVIESVTDLHSCNASKDGLAVFDLTVNNASAIGSQTNVAATYYTNYNDAVNADNAIADPAAFQSTTNPQIIYIRLTNTVTGCFVVAEFSLLLNESSDPVTEFSYTTPVCIEGINPVPEIAPGFTDSGVFTATPQGLAINPTSGNIDLSGSHTGNYTVTYTVPPNNPFCFAPEHTDFSLEINNCMIPRGISPNNDGLNDFFNIEDFDVKELSIFNRYGVKVYSRLNYRKEWDGFSDKGKKLPDATYFYLIELNNGEIRTGWVYINRQK